MRPQWVERLELRRYFIQGEVQTARPPGAWDVPGILIPSPPVAVAAAPYADADPSTPDTVDVIGTAGNDRLVIALVDGDIAVLLNGVDRGRVLLGVSPLAQNLHINTGRGDDVISIEVDGLPGRITILGGAGNDTIFGSAGAERIMAGDGNDLVDAGDGRDTVYGEGGDDVLRGGGGSDVMDGGDGFDTLRGDAGHDNLSGGASRDRIRGALGNDRIAGGGGNDLLAGEAGLDTIDGGAGGDVLAGGDDEDTLTGGGGADSLFGEGGLDDLSGGGGFDAISGGPVKDYFHTLPIHGGDLDTEAEFIDTAVAPTTLIATHPHGNGYVTLTWTYPEGAEVETFETEQSADGGRTWTPLSTHQADDRRLWLVPVADAATHLFRVRARHDSQPSAPTVSAPLAIPPLGVEYITSTTLWGGGVSLRWTDRSASEDRFHLFMAKGDGPFAKLATIGANPESGGEMTRAVRDLAADTEHRFFVRTFHDKLGTSIDSPVHTVRTDPARIDLGQQVDEVESHQPYTLTLATTGRDPTTLRWTVDWGDDSPILTIEPGAASEDLILTHVYESEEYLHAFPIYVTASGDGFADTESKVVMVPPLPGTEYVPG